MDKTVIKKHIRTPLYGAWKVFGWDKGVIGIGIKKSELDNLAEKEGIVDLTVGKSKICYRILAEKARELAKKKDWVMKIPGGPVVYVVPKFVWRRIS